VFILLLNINIIPLILAALMNAKNLWGKRAFRIGLALPVLLFSLAQSYFMQGIVITDVEK
jgi:ABC-type sugar transport system permease subunit